MEILQAATVVYLFLFSLYHIITGIISVLFSDFALKFYRKIYGFQPKETKQLTMIFKPWGNLAFAVGIIGFITLYNLDVFYPMLIAFITLLIIRVWYRFTFRNYLMEELKISPFQNWRMIIVQIIGIIIYLLFIFNKV